MASRFEAQRGPYGDARVRAFLEMFTRNSESGDRLQTESNSRFASRTKRQLTDDQRLAQSGQHSVVVCRQTSGSLFDRVFKRDRLSGAVGRHFQGQFPDDAADLAQAFAAFATVEIAQPDFDLIFAALCG